MRKNIIRGLLLSTALPVAYNAPGWKKDADGKLELDSEGNPIYVNSTGTEQSVKGDTIANLNAEAKTHRTAKEAAEAKLAKYVDKSGKALDPEAAAKAIETVANIDAKKLIDAGEVDKVRETVKAEFTAQMGELTTDRDGWKNKYEDKLVDDVFNDPYMENIAMPKDFFAAAMRKNFKVEDGKVVAYDSAGNRLNSKKDIGNYASPSEALELLVAAHPQKDTLLKAQSEGGSGNNGGGGSRGQGNTLKRAAYDALGANEKAAYSGKLATGEVTLVD